MYWVRKADVDVAQHTEALTVCPRANANFPSAEAEEFRVYQETEDALGVPYFYGLRHFGRVARPELHPRGDVPEFQFAGELKPPQVEALNAVVRAFRDGEGSGILSLFCGAGKTVIALRLVSKMGLKTLILCHKEFLCEQWRERIAQFLPRARVGTIRQKVVDVEDCDIVIAMVQSVALHEYPPGTFDGFGLTVVDEVHHMACRCFSQALQRTWARYNLGLSATPKRSDGLTKVLFWYLDRILYEARRPVERVRVRMVEYVDTAQRELFIGQGRLNIARMVTELTEMADRNDLLTDLLLAELREGRRVIVLSERLAHLRELSDRFRRAETGHTDGWYVGGMKPAERDASNGCDLIWATYSMASEAYDNPGLNTMLLASPKGNVEQSVGRILRGDASQRTKEPRVIDVADVFSVFDAFAQRRRRLYDRMQYEVERSGVTGDSRRRRRRLVQAPNQIS